MGDTDRPPVNEPLPLVAGSRLGAYELVRVIGKGGMGMVWEARHTTLGKRVAIKTLKHDLLDNGDLVSRFMREARAASALRHENAVDVTDVSEAGGTPFFVMDFLEGEPLATRMHQHGALPLKEAVNIAIPILAALGRAHEIGIVHRDIKPGNIFLAKNSGGDVKPMLVDFGISKVASDDDEHLTRDASFMGTPHYAAPEQTYDTKGVDARADQYAVGVVLYEMIAGRRPFSGKTAIDVVIAMREGKYTALATVAPKCPKELADQIQKAMSVLPEDRYPSVREFGCALLPWSSLRVRTAYSKSFGLNDVTGSTDLGAFGLLTPPNGLDLLDEVAEASDASRESSLPPPSTAGSRAAGAASLDITSKRVLDEPKSPPSRGALFFVVGCVVVGVLLGSAWLVLNPQNNAPVDVAPAARHAVAQPGPANVPPPPQPVEPAPGPTPPANAVGSAIAREPADAPTLEAESAPADRVETDQESVRGSAKARVRTQKRAATRPSTPSSTGRTVFPLD